ncbi:MAG: glycoside hydrolase family 3 C-terminal domain-containing protein [Candidatus Nanopelagicales bacterium]|nr:glycoside hydrolase family 3 C-terminal domain-containing protein [Candidatus Nanopelagicales bacterium]
MTPPPPPEDPGPTMKSPRDRAEAIVADLSLADRIRLLSGRDFWNTEAIEDLVPSVMLSDGPHGLRKQAGDADHLGLNDAVPATCFPVAAALACTWDPGLLEEVGAALGREARTEDVAVLLGPGLNLKRHPRCGRNFEYLSEDPYLSGMLAAALVRGIQSEGVAACPKHYAANNQETARMVIDTIIDERTLRELYLRGFEVTLEASDPAVLMTAYNQVNGQFASDHEHLVGQVLRGEWGFDGLVVSDWGGTNDHVAGLHVGMDLEMPGGSGAFDADIAAAVRDGRLAEADVNRSATRVVELALRWQEVRESAEEAVLDFEAHHQLARRAAAAGTVLLTNDGLLPLPAEGTIAVIGAFAVDPRYQGAGSSKVNPTRIDALLESLIAQTAGQAEIRYAPGYDPATGDTTPALMTEAAAVARSADRAVLVVGLPARLETEARDRAEWGMPPGMGHLAEVVLDANPRTVVVLVNGGSVDVPWADRPAALVEAYLGGQAGGSALADVLLGSAEPGGRLAESIPFDVTQLPADANFPGHPRQVEYRETFHVGYRFHDTHDVPARFAFGHGLGYTTFAWGPVDITGEGTDLVVGVDVTNTGPRAGSEVVQVYVGALEPTLPRPAKELVGFAKVHLAPGETARAEVALGRRSFTVWDVAANDWLVEAGDHAILVGASSTDLRGAATVHVGSADLITAVPVPAGPVATDAEFEALLGHPIPVPPAQRPFTRTSTAADLATSRRGRMLLATIRWGLERTLAATETGNMDDFTEAVLAQLPLRSIATSSPVSFAALDRTIASLNNDVRGVLRPRRPATGSTSVGGARG